MKEKTYDIIVHQSKEGGYWGECPALEGCYSQGESLDELKDNMKEAIELYIETFSSNRNRTREKNSIFVMPITI
jgi:predicted RNase H-like HicB family nuclease